MDLKETELQENNNNDNNEKKVLKTRRDYDYLQEIDKKVRNDLFLKVFPLILFAYAFLVYFLFINPFINRYFEIKDYFNVLDQNLVNVEKSVQNLSYFYSKLPELNNIENLLLKTKIPEEGRLGLIIDKLQKASNDFSLEGKVYVDRNNVDNNAGESNLNNDNFLKELSSGETYYNLSEISNNSKIYLLAVKISVSGSKSKFLDFLNSLKDFTPVLNIVSISYQEEVNNQQDLKSGNLNNLEVKIKADLTIESFVLKPDYENYKKSMKYFSKDDPALLVNIPVEYFDVKKEVHLLKDKINSNSDTNSGDLLKDNEKEDQNENYNQSPTSSPSPTENLLF